MNDSDDPEARAERYRTNARKLRRLAFEIRFDYCRQKQLYALAEAFECLADKLEGSPLKHAAD